MKLLKTVWMLYRYPKDSDSLDKEYALDDFDVAAWKQHIGEDPDEESYGDLPVEDSHIEFLQKYVVDPIELSQYDYFLSERGEYEWNR